MNVISNGMFLAQIEVENLFFFSFKKEKIATDSWTRALKERTGEANSFLKK